MSGPDGILGTHRLLNDSSTKEIVVGFYEERFYPDSKRR
jgi:hypothetical protein